MRPAAQVSLFRLHSLRARLLAGSAALVVGVTAVTVAYVSWLADRTVGARLSADLERSRRAVSAAEGERFARLELVARNIASFPELRALLATDAATVRDFLADYRGRHGHAGLVLALDPRGRVVARSDTFAPADLPDAAAWLDLLAGGRPAVGFLSIDGVVHHAVAAAAESAGTIFGAILVAAPIDDGWSTQLRDAVDADIVVVAPGGIAGSSLPRPRVPWRTAADVPEGLDRAPVDLDLTGERFQAMAAALEPDGPRRVIVLQSRDQALAPYRNLQIALLAIGALAAALGLAGSAWLARSITAPVPRLVAAAQEVARGNFDVRLDVARDDEMGQLAGAFNRMTAGLRERADMAKFVSASTVEMIQRRPDGVAPGGDRRTITVLFADIRGFTAFAGSCPPEEAVAVLNRYLRLQADLVKRFNGDVDKFMGDAVFAHFTGADMALDAIRCAVEIQKAIGQAADVDGLSVGVGIATGDVLVGSIGSPDRLDYTAIGPAVNLASRLCAAAEPGQVLLDAETYARVSGLVAATALAPLAVKGVGAPVTVYAMAGRARGDVP